MLFGTNGAGNQPLFPCNRFEKKPTQGQIRYAPNTKIGVVFFASVLDGC